MMSEQQNAMRLLAFMRQFWKKDESGAGVSICNCAGEQVAKWMDEVDALLSGMTEAEARAALAAMPPEQLASMVRWVPDVPDEIDERSRRYSADFIDGFNLCRRQVIGLAQAAQPQEVPIDVELVVKIAEPFEFTDAESGNRQFDRLGFAQAIARATRGRQ